MLLLLLLEGEPDYTCCTIQALRGHIFGGFVWIYRQEALTWLIEGGRIVRQQAMRIEGSSTGKHRFLGMPSNIHQATRGVDGHAGVTPERGERFCIFHSVTSLALLSSRRINLTLNFETRRTCTSENAEESTERVIGPYKENSIYLLDYRIIVSVLDHRYIASVSTTCHDSLTE